VAISIVRLGEPRAADEGLRLGTVRRPPRGVKKEEYGTRDFFDVWMPELAPPAELVSWALSEPFTAKRWARYAKAYRAQMRKPPASRLIKLLAELSHQTEFSVGCYCADETKCHRSLLRELLVDSGAAIK
jgi:uncharacterized protein YeaO (DUF488 family)